MANNGRHLQKRLLAYSAAAVVATAGATQALPGMALETEGAHDNDFDIVLEESRMSSAATSNCTTVAGGVAAVSISEAGYFASAFLSDFSATSGNLYVFGSSNGGATNSVTFPFNDHFPGSTHTYDTNIVGAAFVEVTVDKAGAQFCISGFEAPTAITGAGGQASQAPPSTGYAALAATMLAGLSGAALWLRRKGKTAAAQE